MPAIDRQADMLNDLSDAFKGVRELWHALITRHGLNVSHLFALKHLQRHGASTMSQLTEALNVTHGACTSVVDRLSAEQLVERHQTPNDRRVVQVTLTPQGEAILRSLNEQSKAHFATMLADLSTDDYDKLAQGLKILANAVRSTKAST